MAYSSSILTSSADFTAVSTLTNSLHDETTTGWAALTETFTYASATTITIATGGASRFQKGDRLKFTNTTVKYFVVVTVADTLLTITGGTTYTLANAAITGVYVSRAALPFGFPAKFDYTTTPTGSGALTVTITTTTTSNFSIIGGRCFYDFALITTLGGTADAIIMLTLPVAALSSGTYAAACSILDSTLVGGTAYVSASTLNIRRYDVSNFTLGATRYIYVSGNYPI